MSTGADCRFKQAANGTWTYELQRWPYGECPDYDSFGPFEMLADAEQHLSDHHANPGGWTIRRYPDFKCSHDDLAELDKFSFARRQDGYTHECRRCGQYLKIEA